MIGRHKLTLSMVLVVGACSGSPSAPPQADQQAKQFAPPRPSQGALYVYRAGVMGALRPLDVSLAGGASAQLAYNTFIRVEGPPGPIDIACKVGDNDDERPSSNPGRRDALRRGLDECRAVDAELRRRRGTTRSGPVGRPCLAPRRPAVTIPRYMNVPSGSPLKMMRPTVSKCASRDWICCDSVWMSRNRRSNGVPRKIAEVPAAL